MSSGLMETEAGGQSDQYQSQKTVTVPHSKQGGQMGDQETQLDALDTQQEQQQVEKGAKSADNDGQNVWEEDMGLRTTDAGGSANQEEGYGGTKALGGGYDDRESRRDQGYGPGSGVGG